MKGPWKVTSNIIGEQTMYAVYRLIDTSETDHSGNREFAGNYVAYKGAAEKVAEMLNKEVDQ